MNTFDSSREFAWIRERLAELAPICAEAAVIATNLQGQVAYWNDGAERLYGWPEAEALGREILELTPAKYSLQQSATIMRSLQSGDAWQGDILLRRRDGAPMMAFVLNVPVGDFTGGQGAIVGISETVDNAATIEDRTAQISDAVRRCFESA